MARRIARGLFRLWIVASVLWICAVGAVAWWTFPRPLMFDDIFDPDAYLAGKPQSKPPFDPTKPYAVPPPYTFAPDTLPAARQAAIQTAAEIALIPPVLALAFGAALGWAIRGFRD